MEVARKEDVSHDGSSKAPSMDLVGDAATTQMKQPRRRFVGKRAFTDNATTKSPADNIETAGAVQGVDRTV